LAQNTKVEQELASLKNKNEALLKEKTELQVSADSSKQSAAALQERLSKAKDDLAAANRQLQAAQLDQANASKRAEDAEKTQKELQAEGTSLLRSVEEMRPKIVELTALKLELTERVEELERIIRNRDATISRLETALEEVRDKHDTAEKKWKETMETSEKKWKEQTAQHNKDHSAAQMNASDMQKALAELQEELNSAHASVRTLESDRSNYHQEAARRMEEIEQLTATTLAQDEELVTLRQELEERQANQVF
jgi:chromosome segregation ATPase